jgi:hypothetical protein
MLASESFRCWGWSQILPKTWTGHTTPRDGAQLHFDPWLFREQFLVFTKNVSQENVLGIQNLTPIGCWRPLYIQEKPMTLNVILHR